MSAPPAEPLSLRTSLLCACVVVVVIAGGVVAANHGLFWHALIAYVVFFLWLAHKDGKRGGPGATGWE